MSTEVLTSVPGNIWKVLVNVGGEVKEGDVLFIMEVMKSEVNHNAPVNGTVSEVNIQNDQEGVNPGTIAIVID
jgi:biotin carboxyl carrier protein